MLSSIIDDMPVASTWLDRLRVNRGVSTAEDEDAFGNPRSLDDFLRRNHQTEIPAGDPATSSASDSPPPAPIPSDPEFAESPSEPASGEWYGAMSDVLSRLFGGSSTTAGKKLPRKQSNPRHCSEETPAEFPLPRNQLIDRECLSGAREFTWGNSYNEKPAPETRERRRTVPEAADGVEDEEEEGEKDLVGFSRSEVTVIDTSFDNWKSEKLVFRRRNIWKVRDKKGKSRIASSKKKTIKDKKKKKKKNKKRKCDDDDDEDAPRRKKMKRSTSVPDDKSRSHSEEVHDEPESSNANRIPLRRLRSKPRKEGSFGLNTSNKNSEPEARGP
ncbi:unnamed protein product [Microthlaspi erraticum]|uniref:Uncharacterized protein n=1 Tax=Microthlaspi erraticum TaxID=1685480 RepID=A0A6D2IB32_9BRAS|nr:unnamed protein product [Microthlaspi erraticum]